MLILKLEKTVKTSFTILGESAIKLNKYKAVNSSMKGIEVDFD